MVPGSLCSQGCKPELPRSMGEGWQPAGVRAGSQIASVSSFSPPAQRLPVLTTPNLCPFLFPHLPPAQPREGGPGCRSLHVTT